MTTTDSITWTPEAIAQAHSLHCLLLEGPILDAERREELMAAAPEVRRAARTIAACRMPFAALPKDPEIGPMLPLDEALRVFASGTDWFHLALAEASQTATDHLVALQSHYDVDHLSPGDVIAATLFPGVELIDLWELTVALEGDGDYDSCMVTGLFRALARTDPKALSF